MSYLNKDLYIGKCSICGYPICDKIYRADGTDIKYVNPVKKFNAVLNGNYEEIPPETSHSIFECKRCQFIWPEKKHEKT